MNNGRKHRRNGTARTLPPPDGRRPVDAYSAADLHRQLVTDGVARYIGASPEDERRYLAWVVAACTRIGQVDGCGPEEAFQRIDAEVFALCGQHLRVA